jgi:C4-dicarboxylate-specific signal transduction histidine kinase
VDDTLRAADVIDHIRLLLRKGEQSVEVVDLNEICQQAATLLQRDAGLRQARLEIQLEPEGLPVTGDGVQLQQVVINLALNALDAAAHSDGERLVMISTRVAGGTAEVLVRDTGPGFEPKVKDHLFEPFFSTKSQGLGMGLAIVRSILERHKGRIRADNHPSGGALFRVTLPLAASDRELPMADSFALASKLTVEAGERQANGSPAWMRT